LTLGFLIVAKIIRHHGYSAKIQLIKASIAGFLPNIRGAE
jgi:hypothetical protein